MGEATFEYVLLGGVNDSDADARRVVRLLAKPELQGQSDRAESGPRHSLRDTAEPNASPVFKAIVRKSLPCFLRKPRGRDIFAACGQLKRVSKELIQVG